MSALHLFCRTAAGRLCVSGASDPASWRLRDIAAGTDLPLAVIGTEGEATVLDASALTPWSPEHPYLYMLETPQGNCRFGYCDLAADGSRAVLLNGKMLFLRGVIRGIVAHDHPNLTGLPEKAAYEKYIRQAKKYGFNLVRFHSTIPDESFVAAADELGFLIHLEIGFSYEYDNEGGKKQLKIDRELWRETILRYRNHPSLAVFCLGNEMHHAGRNPDVRALIAEGRALAPGKLFMDNSGWGEYDRDTADVYAQHFAYYLPYKHHSDMFESDECWRFDDSAFGVPVDEAVDTPQVSAAVHREMANQRPVFAHEAMHYIEMVDYAELNRRFDAFCAAAGPEYLAAHDIRKPRYLTELPALICQKKLEGKMPDYIRGSQIFRQAAMKIYLEKLRFSRLCGFEMLQFADCLKYENKNGIVDCFDDDKSIDAGWFREFNADAVLLAEFGGETFYRDEPVEMRFFISDFLEQPRMTGTLTVRLNGEIFWRGEHVSVAGGLQKLVTLRCRFAPKDTAEKITVSAEFIAGDSVLKNAWNIWLYPRVTIEKLPELALDDRNLTAYIQSFAAPPAENLDLTDRLDDAVLRKLEGGRHVILLYHRNAPANRYIFPCTLERFKPCIWDRGSNLGGFITSEFLARALGSKRYFDVNMQPLLEGNCKINLDKFPFPVREIVCGIDKPVRDRMRGLIYGEKNFIAEDTLRNFSHLFSVGVGRGMLTVCTLFPAEFRTGEPVAANLLATLLNCPEQFAADCRISVAELREFLQEATAAGNKPEDTMNFFWEIDNKPVEDTLFWEEARVDLSKLK
ncbi:MAG: hypothetical protein MR051_02650 [Lentisphaeria bacterium]|nr:hypothetical protein [Lentisphaeria bacterium]